MTAWIWPSSEATDKVIPAFVAALQAVEDVARNKKAAIDTKTGGKIQYGYADLDAVLDAIKPQLTTQGLAFTQAPAHDGVHAVLMHSSGQWLSFPPLQVSPTQNTPQALGSALSYARRYQALAMLNIASEDDDGKEASKRKPAAKATTDVSRAANGPSTAQLASDAQLKAVAAALSAQGVRDREDRHRYIVAVIGHPIKSAKELTKQEAGAVLDALKGAG